MAKKKELTDADVFKAFGVGRDEVDLRKYIHGQRKINGKLYKAIDLIGEALKVGPGKKYDRLIATANKINDSIPGEPPGCSYP
jgi:hypothetical protein